MLIAQCLFAHRAGASQGWRYGDNMLRITAEGSAGAIRGDAFADYLLRLQLSRELSNKWNVAVVYAIDADAVDMHQAARDAFAYVEHERGRIEVGWTDSVAAKLGLKLPDVGGTRMNNAPFFLRDDFAGITHPSARGGQYAFRANAVSSPAKAFQIGFGRTIAPASTFDSSADMGIKYRNVGGRVKSSAAVGASYIRNPRGMIADIYLPPVFADARYQWTAGVNVHWGSLLWAATGKIVRDENPVGDNSEGIQVGTGASYDFLQWSASANYIFSDVGIFRDDAPVVQSHTGIVSMRYKIDKNFNIWGSGGAVWSAARRDDWFISAGVGVEF